MSIQDSVAELKRRVDIVELISTWVPLKRMGKAWGGLCPFHRDTKPSFYVWSERGYYRCFGCGAAGDIISFMMAFHHMDFVDAVRELGRRYGVEVKVGGGPRKKTKPLVEANKAAEEFFRSALRKSQTTMDYLTSRGFSQRTLEEWGVGYAPPGDELFKFMRRRGIADSLLLEAGLAVKRAERLLPLLRDRVVFPIRDARGVVVGFGGRALKEDAHPKYINTPETPLFKKSEILFGINRIKVDGGVVVVTEGYTDVMAAHQAGMRNFVGVLGTAFGEGHARLLSRYADEVVLLYDADSAGKKAAERSIDSLVGAGLFVRIGLLPEGMDVCDCVSGAKEGLVREALDKAVSFVEFIAGLYGGDERGRVKAVERVGAVLSAMDEVSRQVWAEKAAGMLGVLPSALLSAARGRTRKTAPPKVVPPEHARDWDLIEAMLFEPELASYVREEFPTSSYRDEALAAVASHIYGQADEGRLSLEELYEERPELREKVRAVLERGRQMGAPNKDYRKIVEGYARKERRRRLFEEAKRRACEGDVAALKKIIEIKKGNKLGDGSDV